MHLIFTYIFLGYTKKLKIIHFGHKQLTQNILYLQDIINYNNIGAYENLRSP